MSEFFYTRSWLYIATYLIIALGAFFHIRRLPKHRPASRSLEIILLWFLAVSAIIDFVAFYIHIFTPDMISEYYGWSTGSPFQFEVAGANLAFGVLGVLCIWFRNHFWTATIIGNAIFDFNVGIVHLTDLVTNYNTSPANVGVSLYLNIISAIFAIVLLIAYRSSKKYSELL